MPIHHALGTRFLLSRRIRNFWRTTVSLEQYLAFPSINKVATRRNFQLPPSSSTTTIPASSVYPFCPIQTYTHSRSASEEELKEMNGIKPKSWIPEGEEREVRSQTSKSVYKIKHTMNHFWCSCHGWRTAGGAIDARTCKHLKSYLGEEYEAARLKRKIGDAGPADKSASKAKGTTKAKHVSMAKLKRAEDEEGYEDGELPKKRTKDNRKAEAAHATKTVPELLLANKWDLETSIDPTGWWVSEKLDGVRSLYDGTQFLSRLGNTLSAPSWFLDQLPKHITLDGELTAGRGQFQSTVSIVKTANSTHWNEITFEIFDAPSLNKPFEERYNYLVKTFGSVTNNNADAKDGEPTNWIRVVLQEKARDKQHVLEKLKEVEGKGGEGLMLRKPGSMYEGRRSSTLFKVKSFYDAEAIVIGHTPGKGKYQGDTGALECEMENGKIFKVGTGMSDETRRKPPKISSIITYRFQELSKNGSPRFPSYAGVAIDKDRPKDAVIPLHRRMKGSGGDV